MPLENYVQMLAIFGTGIATGRYAMTSNEALGVASMVGTSPSVVNIEGSGFEFVVDGNEPDSSATAAAHGEAAVAHSTGKRKRASLMSEEEVLVMTNMSEAVREVANAIKSTTEAHPELYDAVMELPGFSEDDLLIILNYLNESANRARSHSFVQMTETRRTRWVRLRPVRSPDPTATRSQGFAVVISQPASQPWPPGSTSSTSSSAAASQGATRRGSSPSRACSQGSSPSSPRRPWHLTSALPSARRTCSLRVLQGCQDSMCAWEVEARGSCLNGTQRKVLSLS